MQKCISGNQESSAASRMMGKNDAKNMEKYGFLVLKWLLLFS